MIGMRAKKYTPAFSFILLMGIVSLFADMTHEGARSIYGAYLGLLGASAATIGFVSGAGEFIGYSLRIVTGIIADKMKNYWAMTIIGYLFNIIAIPLLALVPENGWIWASSLIIAERMGKAIRQPAKNTLLSFAATQVGVGKSFAIQEFLDQIGAFLGPVLLFMILWSQKEHSIYEGYIVCFAFLAIPAILTMFFLLVAKRKFPHPENFETTEANGSKKFHFTMPFIIYLTAISFFALGFINFPLITMHIANVSIVHGSYIPLFYAAAMAVDAFAALLFGYLYDKYKYKILLISSSITFSFPFFIFYINNIEGIIVGVCL